MSGQQRVICRLVAAAIILFLFPAYAISENRLPAAAEVPWKDERLVFQIRWGLIQAGTAVMEAAEISSDGGKKGYHFSAVTTSSEFVDIFLKIRDRVDSYTSYEDLRSEKYKVHQEEGSFKRDKEIRFNYETGMATYIRDKKVSMHSIPEFVQDSLSSMYYLRTKQLVAGKPIIIDVFDDRKLWQVDVQVLKKEKIETPAGVFDTILVKPLLKFEGIFQRKGEVYIWLTDDNKKMPVRMRSKVKIGSISADLVEYR